MLKLLPLLLLLLVSTAEARDRSGQLSGGAGLGLAVESPWATKSFRENVGVGPRGSVFGRYHHDSSYGGFELALDYFKMSKQDLASKSLTLYYFWRYRPEARLHPILALGLGAAKVQKFFSRGDMDSAIYALRAGVEYELDSRSDIAFHLDHFSIFRDLPADPNAQVLVPSINYIRYFGSAPVPVIVPDTKVVANANIDSDADGIPDALDKCPGTPKGTAVNSLGCAEKQSFEVRLDVKFRSGTAEMVGSSEEALRELAQILQQNKDLKVEIQGHTDSSGSKAKNEKLSQARADAVRKKLVNANSVDESRLTAKGYGASMPVDTNNNAGGRANNRRVTAKVLR